MFRKPAFKIARQTRPSRIASVRWLTPLALLLPAVWLPGLVGSPQDRSPVFYPEPPETPRIQFLATYNSQQDLGKKVGGFRRFVLGAEQKDDGIIRPYGVAFFDNQIFVCDSRAAAVGIFDLKKKEFRRMGNRSPGRLNRPINIAIDSDGTRYVADTGHRRIMVYDRDDRYLRALGDPDKLSPSDLVIAKNNLYVCDVDNGQVVILDKQDGTEQQRIGSKGAQEGELFFPTNLAVDPDGNLYVADTGNARIVEFDRRGKFKSQFGHFGDRPGTFTRPKGLAVDRNGYIYVVDAAFENIQIFDRNEQLLLFFGGPGNGPGGINLPAQILIDYDHVPLFQDKVAPGYKIGHLILVTSQYGDNKVNVYAFLERND